MHYIDLALLQLNQQTADAWMRLLRARIAWLDSPPPLRPVEAFMDAVGTKAYLRRDRRLELHAEGTFGDDVTLVVEREHWSWR